MLIDITFAVLLVIACIRGYQRGLVIALFSVIAFIIGLAAALKLSAAVAVYLQGTVNVSNKWLPFISFLVVFLVVVLLIRLGGKMIEKSLQLVLLGWLNRLGGIVFFVVLYTIIFSVFLFYAEMLHFIQPSVIESSQTYSFVQPWGPKLINGFGDLIPWFKDIFSDLEKFFESLQGRIS